MDCTPTLHIDYMLQVLAAAQQVLRDVNLLVASTPGPGRSSSPAWEGEEEPEEAEADMPQQKGGRGRVAAQGIDPSYASKQAERAFDEFSKAMELWALRVSPNAIDKDLDLVSMWFGCCRHQKLDIQLSGLPVVRALVYTCFMTATKVVIWQLSQQRYRLAACSCTLQSYGASMDGCRAWGLNTNGPWQQVSMQTSTTRVPAF